MDRRDFISSFAVAGAASAAALIAVPASARASVREVGPSWPAELRAALEAMADRLTATLGGWTGPETIFRPEDFGHDPADGGLATAAIQAAIDAAFAAGGGTVRLDAGDYVSGTIDLRSNVRLLIDEGARLLGSPSIADYPDRIAARPTVMDSNMGMNQSLIFAESAENIALHGRGVIDGQGSPVNFPGDQTQGATPGRPFLIRVLDCRGVHVRGLKLRDAACWMQNYLNCEDVLIEDIDVLNQVNHNNDGLDIDGCRRVIVRRCVINAEDDAMCFKGASLMPTEDVLVEDCVFYSNCNAIKFGTDSQSDFRRVLVRRCEAGGTPWHLPAKRRKRCDSGISWEIVDGGTLEDVYAHDISIDRALSPLFVRLGDRARVRPEAPRPPAGRLRRIAFERIFGLQNGPRGSYMIGIPGARIEDIWLHDVQLGVEASDLAGPLAEGDFEEKPAHYPDAHMYGALVPAYGLWMRHVDRATLSETRFRLAGDDPRPEILAQTGTSAINRGAVD